MSRRFNQDFEYEFDKEFDDGQRRQTRKFKKEIDENIQRRKERDFYERDHFEEDYR